MPEASSLGRGGFGHGDFDRTGPMMAFDSGTGCRGKTAGRRKASQNRWVGLVEGVGHWARDSGPFLVRRQRCLSKGAVDWLTPSGCYAQSATPNSGDYATNAGCTTRKPAWRGSQREMGVTDAGAGCERQLANTRCLRQAFRLAVLTKWWCLSVGPWCQGRRRSVQSWLAGWERAE